jgi:solute carrier family 25 carnitine/acylcarnitine transporter 20/29
MQRFAGPWHCVKDTLRKEGMRGFYKGATPPLLGWALMDSVQLGTLTNLRLLLKKEGKELSTLDHALAGLGAGIVVSFVATPVEVLKARLQVQYNTATALYTGPIDCAKQLLKENGIRGLYKGLDGCLLFRSFFWLLWGSYEVYGRKFKEWGMKESIIPFFAGGMAANTFWAVSFPCDAIKNRLMTRPSTNPPFNTITECFRYILRTEGWRGFYRGYVPCLLRSFPTNASAVFVFQWISGLGEKVVLFDPE